MSRDVSSGHPAEQIADGVADGQPVEILGFQPAPAKSGDGLNGYAPRRDTYMGPETPNPISVKVLRGDCSLETVLSDVLGLTKINFNSCLHNDRLPVTIRFANAVGDVLISAPMDSEPKLPFKFYI